MTDGERETVREVRLDVDAATVHVPADFHEEYDRLYDAVEDMLREAGVRHADFSIIESYEIEAW